eukprot:2354838-Prymnesium_polylepis.1
MRADMHAIPDSMLQRSYAPSVRAAVSRSDTALCVCRSCATHLRRHLVQACSRAVFALSALCLAACPCAFIELAILQRSRGGGARSKSVVAVATTPEI